MKMYLLLKDTVPLGYAINAIGHGVLMAHFKWQNDKDYSTWLALSFKKVTCKVDLLTFEKFKQFTEHVIVTESRLNGEEVALVFKPREKFPEEFKKLILYNK